MSLTDLQARALKQFYSDDYPGIEPITPPIVWRGVLAELCELGCVVILDGVYGCYGVGVAVATYRGRAMLTEWENMS